MACNEEVPGFNFRKTDWQDFHDYLSNKLGALHLRDPEDTADFERMLDELTTAILETMENHVPKSNPSPYHKRWWSKELSQKRTALRKLAKKAYLFKKKHPGMDSPILEQHRQARNKYGEEVWKARSDHWEEWIESTKAMGLYVINKFVMAAPSDGSSTRVPTLKVKQADGSSAKITDNKGKSKALYDAFFYPPPAENDIDPNFVYPPPKVSFKNMTDDQIHHAIRKLKPYSAPGPNSISNSVFTHCTDILVPWLGALYRATFHLRYYPKRWQEYITIVLRKPGKPDYLNPKAYRPIALLDTMAKILSLCVAEDLFLWLRNTRCYRQRTSAVDLGEP
jgi:hypothetical protein